MTGILCRRQRRVSRAMAAVVATLFAAMSATTGANNWGEEYARRIKATQTVAPLTDTMFGDNISLFNGTVAFSVTDVSIPGNSAIPVELKRTYNLKKMGNDLPLGTWEIDTPRLQAVHPVRSTVGHWAPVDRCSTVGAPPSHGTFPNAFQAREYWAGTQLHAPGGGGDLLSITSDPKLVKPTATENFSWHTKDGWFFSCLSALKNVPAVPGQGFVGHAPDGLKYKFDYMVLREHPAITKIDHLGLNGVGLERKNVQLQATEVSDRFGNWVKYDWQNGRLERIHSNDLREIDLVYAASGRLAQVKVGNRTWTYVIDATGRLSDVVNPDTSRWVYEQSGSMNVRYKTNPRYPMHEPNEYLDEWPLDCNRMHVIEPHEPTFRVTHPSGAQALYTFRSMRHGRTNVPRSCLVPGDNIDQSYNAYAAFHEVMSLRTKQVSGVGLEAATTSYTYDSLDGAYDTSGPPPHYKIVTVTKPDSTQVIHSFGKDYAWNEGQLLKVVTKKAGVIYSTTSNIYISNSSAASAQFPASNGSNYVSFGDSWTAAATRPIISTTITQDGVDFARTYSSFDRHARPAVAVRANSLGFSRTERTAYVDWLDKWILGQVASVKCTAPATCINASWPGGMELSRTTYSSTHASPLQTYAFGKLQQTLTYNTDGTLASVSDGRDSSGFNTTILLSNWKRGIPQTVQYPATPDQPSGASQSAVVDANGWITSVTDERGATTGYQYDGTMGRLTQINYPAESAEFNVAWNATASSFSPIGGAVYGLPAGHWIQIVSTGDARKRIRYDALWRPVVEETYDDTDSGGTRTIVVKRYDAAGRLAFQSHPQRTISNWATVTSGTSTLYDALGRVTETSVPSSDPGTTNGAFRTRIDYLTGFQQKVTSPNNKVTTTSYLAWDEPITDFPVAIAHPEGAYTDIARDALGKPTEVVRRDQTSSLAVARSLVYRQDTQELCRSVEPETGSTVMDYDAAGNLAWSASGMSIGGTSACSFASVPAAARTLRSYDARNRLKMLMFPDEGGGYGNGDQEWDYLPNGLPSMVSTWNIGAPGAQASETVNIYVYNKRGLLERETVAVPAWYTFSVDHAYNSNGHVKETTYPSGNTVHFTLNALGQPSRLASTGGADYAREATYFPNGAVEQFDYGNGIVHTMDQTDRQLPRRSWTRKDGIHYLDDVYAYDGNGNVTSITDSRPVSQGGGTRTRTMDYDGLDRLKTVVSPMYGAAGATYTYNVLDDLTRVKIGGSATRDHYYCYDQYRQLTGIRTGPCTGGTGSTVHGLGYDAQGNLANKDGQHYRFDYGNRLREVIDVERYRYDAHGRRVLAMQFAAGTVLSMYGQDGRLMYQRSDRTGKQSDYLYLGSSLVAIRDEPIGGGAGTLKYQHTDALGSPVAVTAHDRTVLETTQYEPYGKVLNRPVHDGPGYTGHVEDAATGLVQMQQRYYDPGIGRFLSVDPVTANTTNGSNFNRYKYANNNPYRFVDPDGRLDLSLFAPDDKTSFVNAGEQFQMNGFFTAGGHGGKFPGDGMIAQDQRGYSAVTKTGDRINMRAAQFWITATNSGLQQGQSAFLAICQAGLGGFAQSVARMNQSDVWATKGFAMYKDNGDGSTRISANSRQDGKGRAMTFDRYTSSGIDSSARSISSVTARADGSYAVRYAELELGSRIRKTEIVNPK